MIVHKDTEDPLVRDAINERRGMLRFVSGEQVGVSTCIAGTTTYGYGELDDNGFWQYPVPTALVRFADRLTDESSQTQLEQVAEILNVCTECGEQLIGLPRMCAKHGPSGSALAQARKTRERVQSLSYVLRWLIQAANDYFIHSEVKDSGLDLLGKSMEFLTARNAAIDAVGGATHRLCETCTFRGHGWRGGTYYRKCMNHSLPCEELGETCGMWAPAVSNPVKTVR